MHNFIKKLDKRFGGHTVFWGGVIIFIILLLILGFSLVREVKNDHYAQVTFSRSGFSSMPMSMPMRGIKIESNTSVIRSGALSLLTRTAEEGVNSVSGIATRYGGFVESSQLYDISDDTRGGEVTVRVPNAYFEAAVRDIKGGAVRVISENIDSQDQTQSTVDLTARITNLKAEEKQYRDLIAKTTNVGDILQIRAALSNVQGKIELLQGELDYLSREAAMSSISVSITSQKAAAVVAPGLKTGNVVKDGLQNFVDDLLSFTQSLILFVFALPVLIFKVAVFGLILIGIWKIILWVEREFQK